MRNIVRTLRFKLTVLYLAVFGILLTAISIAIVTIHRNRLTAEIDDLLLYRAGNVLDEFEYRRDEGLGLTAGQRRRPYFPPTSYPKSYIQFRNGDGILVHRSKSLIPSSTHGEGNTTQPAHEPQELPLTDDARLAKTSGQPRMQTISGHVADTLVSPGAHIRMITLYHDPPSGPPFFLQVGLSLSEVDKADEGLRRIFMIVIPGGLLAAGFGSWLMARRSLAPIGRIARQARALTARHLDRRIAVPAGQDEVAEMAATINQMLDRLEAAFRAQERFVADAAHELKTPVAIMLGGAQVLTQKSRTPEEYDQFIASIQDEMRRIGQMVDSLLTLARADAGMPLKAAAPVSINEVVMEAVQRCQPLARQREVRLSPSLAMPRPDKPEAVVVGDAELLCSMVANLLRNAIRHSPVDQPVEVAVTLDGSEVSIRVRDHGPGLAREHIERVFDRFYQVPGDESRLRGSGLGLAIAKSVAGLHRGTIDVSNRPPGGCEFEVRMPVARP